MRIHAIFHRSALGIVGATRNVMTGCVERIRSQKSDGRYPLVSPAILVPRTIWKKEGSIIET